ncbi:MAG: DNA polymerase III subunit beta [Spirochaetia bacterium]|jgi:DNA polymerase-3 subunit beta|nr:DNA polymerase III subunit beta [Spirochaetia bacterium]
MKINADKEQLLKSIITADAIISKNVNTILSNCLFNVTENQVEIISTDNEMAIRTRFDAVSEGSVSFTANGKKFSSILKEFPEGEIIADINDTLLVSIKTASKEIKGRYSLVGSSAEDYPDIPVFEEKNIIEIEQSTLKEMIRKVVYAATHDTLKTIFNGILIVIENGSDITAVATDSRRLAMITRKLDTENNESGSFIIPLKTVGELLRLLESSGRCRLSYNERQCFFKIGNTEIISRIVDGLFPDYKHVIPADHSMDVVVETKKLVDSVRRVSVFTKEPASKIICKFSGNSLTLEANTPDLGEAEEELDIENSSTDLMTIGVNSQFLLDCLKEIDSFSIKCGLSGQMSPITFVPENDSFYISVIMPIQIKSGYPD